MFSLFGLGTRREQRLLELLALLHALGDLDPMDRPLGFILLPSASGDVTPHNRLNRENLELLHNHRPPLELVFVLRNGLGNRGGDEMVRAFRGKEGKPEFREGGEEFSLVGDTLRNSKVAYVLARVRG